MIIFYLPFFIYIIFLLALIVTSNIAKKNKKYNLTFRIVSSIILLCIFIICLLNNLVFLICLFSIYVGMITEWIDIVRNNRPKLNLLDILLVLFAIFISLVSVITFIISNNTDLLVCAVLCVIITDTFAFIGGKVIKGKKLIPVISPNKTWSGLLSGVCTAVITITTYQYITLNSLIKTTTNDSTYVYTKILSSETIKFGFATLITSVAAQVSDLMISFYKRKSKIKNSGTFFAGHGGFLDRFDGWIIAIPVFLIICYVLSI